MSDLELFADSPYTYNGVHVPRVTEILGSMLTEEYLMYWAQKMGRYGKNIDDLRDSAADKGTIVHSFCEEFLRYRYLPDFSQRHSELFIHFTKKKVHILGKLSLFYLCKIWYVIHGRNLPL